MNQINNFKPLIFRPRMDWWVGLIVGLFVLILLSGIPLLIWRSGFPYWLGILAALLIALTAIFYIDIGFYSRYILGNEEIMIASHFRRITIPYRMMRSLSPGGFWSLVTISGHKRFALSRKNVIIRLASNRWRSISVSPVNQDQFINAIMAQIDQERSRRSSRGHNKPS